VATPPRHVLVVDDEPHIGLLLRPHLERLGYRVSIARTLADARVVIASRSVPVDGLLLDLHLPDGSGLSLLKEIRGSREQAAMPVLVLTADGDDHILTAVQQLDATLFTKPFSPSKLTTRVAAMLGDAAPPEGRGP
jgi:DNA-binding response OmpR family regulator